jgi:hypothetical protein
MYLIIVFILILVLGIYIYSASKEGFNTNLVDVLPIQITEDNTSISVPNQIRGNIGNDITFGGNIQAPRGTANHIQVSEYATLNNLSVNGDSQLNQTTIKGKTSIVNNNLFEWGSGMSKSKPENGTIGYKTGLDGNALNIVGADLNNVRKVHLWDNVEIGSNLHVNGSIKLGSGNNIWTIRVRPDNGWLEFLLNNTGQDDYGANVGHVIMSPQGDLWLARDKFAGWVTQNMQNIYNKGV